MSNENEEAINLRSQRVVLVHGLGSHRVLLMPLARALRRAGFATDNWGYSSLRRPIEHSGDLLASRLAQWNANPTVTRVHVVAHSMGNLLTRYALGQGTFPKLHRFVMLAPPNQGSPVARHVAPLLARLVPPIGQLSDAPDSWIRTLVNVPNHIQVGIIVARYDFLVPQSSTQLSQPTPVVVVPTTHTGLLFHKGVASHVVHFLRTGQFVGT